MWTNAHINFEKNGRTIDILLVNLAEAVSRVSKKSNAFEIYRPNASLASQQLLDQSKQFTGFFEVSGVTTWGQQMNL